MTYIVHGGVVPEAFVGRTINSDPKGTHLVNQGVHEDVNALLEAVTIVEANNSPCKDTTGLEQLLANEVPTAIANILSAIVNILKYGAIAWHQQKCLPEDRFDKSQTARAIRVL